MSAHIAVALADCGFRLRTLRLLGVCAAVLCGRPWTDGADSPGLFTASHLKTLSVEELMELNVTTVSRREEKLRLAPSAIQVISDEDIRRSVATTLPEALRLANNLNVAQKNPHDWAISARGFNANVGNKLARVD
jgi:outer membrane receptor protein involved in Fe transport